MFPRGCVCFLILYPPLRLYMQLPPAGVQSVIQLGQNPISLKGSIVPEVFYEADTGMRYSWGDCLHSFSQRLTHSAAAQMEMPSCCRDTKDTRHFGQSSRIFSTMDNDFNSVFIPVPTVPKRVGLLRFNLTLRQCLFPLSVAQVRLQAEQVLTAGS